MGEKSSVEIRVIFHKFHSLRVPPREPKIHLPYPLTTVQNAHF